MRLEEAVKRLKEANLKIPYEVQKEAQKQERRRRGVVEVWICSKCPGFIYESPIKSTATWCKKDHAMERIWTDYQK